MKKVIALVLALVMCFALVACSNGEDKNSEKDQLARIKEAGVMTVATEGTWAPWTYHDAETDELTGFDVELAKLVGEKIGVRVDFIEAEWDGLFGGLDAQRYDAVFNCVGYTDERAQTLDFSDAYVSVRTVVITRDDDDRINKMEDLNGMTTANTISSTYALLAEQYGATAQGVDDLNQTLELVMAGRVDATLNSELSYWEYKNAKPDSNIKIAVYADEAEAGHIPVRKGEDSASFLKAINEAIAELREDGTLSALSQQFFGTDVTNVG